ncbi:hypothetical protein ACFYPN_16045 [Streptomyces sp. NPDC005576]|uniref:hypothetical protein n=1 Tax=Streptomyces sp. NPDC005576 TaxID=3364726 RepID=UPI0036BF6371
MKKNLLWIAAAVVLLILFPDLAQTLGALVSAVVLWLSTQPLLIGVGIGMVALPHLSRTTKTVTPADH